VAQHVLDGCECGTSGGTNSEKSLGRYLRTAEKEEANM